MNAAPRHLRDVANEREARIGLFLSAVLRDGLARHVVRVRNVSLHGAMVEGPTLPAFGAHVVLERGDISAPATVSWATRTQCGLHFDHVIDPLAWRLSPQRLSQCQIEAQVVGIRAGFQNPQKSRPLPDDLSDRIAEEIGAVRRHLDICLDVMAGYAPLVVRNGQMLQEMEVAGQVLGHLEALLKTDDCQTYLDNLGMSELKRRLLR